jgi:hypothetical protein
MTRAMGGTLQVEAGAADSVSLRSCLDNHRGGLGKPARPFMETRAAADGALARIEGS